MTYNEEHKDHATKKSIGCAALDIDNITIFLGRHDRHLYVGLVSQ